MATTGVVNGTDLLVYVGTVAVACATSHTLNIGQDMRDTSSKCSAGYKTQLPGQRNWTIDGEGLFAFDSPYGFSDLYTLWSTRAKVTLKFSTEVAGDKRYSGEAYLSSLSASAPNEDNTTFSFSFEGTGPLTETTNT